MKLNRHLKDWKQIISQRFPHLSLPQINGLATWSFGMVITRSSSLSKVSTIIAKINQEKENTVRQRLKEWYKEGTAKAKNGNKRVSLDVKECFPFLLAWIVDLLAQTTQELLIALDATNIGQHFTVLSINVLYRGSAIPVAWKIVKGTEKGSWKPYWQELLFSLKDIIPINWKVIVATDRGLYADWLFKAIIDVGWHPFLRINHQGLYRSSNSSNWQPLARIAPHTGTNWTGKVICFKTKPIDCTLLVRWEQGYTDPWLILTDLSPSDADISWYGFRFWIECSYRDIKSDGWQWHKTRLRSPERAERHWLAMAVALLWMLTLGAEQEIIDRDRAITETLVTDKTQSSNPSVSANLFDSGISRQISCFVNGLLSILACLLKGEPLSLGYLLPTSFNSFHHFTYSNSS